MKELNKLYGKALKVIARYYGESEETHAWGINYASHLHRVEAHVFQLTQTEEPEFRIKCMIVALLHDVVEDGLAKMLKEGFKHIIGEEEFTAEIYMAVDALNRQKEEKYLDYVKRASENKIAKYVKWADLLDNSSLDTDAPLDITAFRAKRYKKALDLIKGHRNRQ